MNGTSRVTGDCQARFWEGLGVKFPGPTRPVPRAKVREEFCVTVLLMREGPSYRLAGVGHKPPSVAAVKSCGDKRRRKRPGSDWVR